MSPDAQDFTRFYDASSLLDKETEIALDASDGECDRIANRLDLLSLTHFHTEFVITPWRKTGLRVVGTLTANVEQPCSITLEPVADHIKEDIDLRYLPENDLKKLQQENGSDVLDLEKHDPPELLTESLDLGAIAVEFLTLALNPYPRKPGASIDENDLQPGGQESMSADASNGRDEIDKEGPFSALGKWKNRLK